VRVLWQGLELSSVSTSNSHSARFSAWVSGDSNPSLFKHSCARVFSTSSQEQYEDGYDDGGEEKEQKAPVTALESVSLRKVANPFLMLCHPDKIPALPQTQEPRTVNLKAVQSLNSFIDTMQSIVDGLKCGSVAGEEAARAVEAVTFVLEEIQSSNKESSRSTSDDNNQTTTFGMIEFMIPTGDGAQRLEDSLSSASSPHDQSLVSNSRRHKDKLIYTRRAVLLRVPSKLLWDIHESLSTVGDPSRRREKLCSLLKFTTLKQLVRLLKSAGQPVSYSLSRLLSGSQFSGMGGSKELMGDLGFDGGYGSAREYSDGYDEEEEGQPTFKIDWELEMKRYEIALKNYDHDIATLGVLEQETRLRQDVVAGVVSRVRYIGDVSGLDQLITLRRITLLMQDNFDHLQVSDYLRLWQNLVIILEDDGSGVMSSSGGDDEPNLNSIRRRRFKMKGQSGFKFALLEDDLLVITVPLSFGDKEFVDEIYRHLYHFDMNSNLLDM
jgi:hypothetical protein